MIDQWKSRLAELAGSMKKLGAKYPASAGRGRRSPFWVLVQKEVADHVNSWRFYALMAIILLTCLGSLYTSLNHINDAVRQEPDGPVFLKLFTISDGTLPALITFVSFLGPLLGIGLGFDAVNSERNKGTLSRLMAQPLHRDVLLNAKFAASMIVIAFLFFALGFLTMGFGLMMIGIPPSPEEFLRMVIYLAMAVFYVGFWLNLAIFFSVRFRQPATSALTSISIWLFFSIFYSMIVELIARGTAPSSTTATTEQIIRYQENIQTLSRINPSQLFDDATTTLLTPSVRSLGPLTMEQVVGAIPSPLPLAQSLLLVWPQWTGLIAATVICFALSYVSFMRQEIRSR